MNNIKLSYVMTTYNKLPYLKEAMKRLLENVQEDEEIVITDGASTDGTVEYLTELYQQGKIHQFLSEPDKGEAHGFNKGMLMARGELIKIITDDDVFYYPAIQECKKFMLEHPEVDVMSGNAANIEIEDLRSLSYKKTCYENYMKWLSNGTPVWFTGLPLVIRKVSLPLTGIFFTGTMGPDTDFSMRITHLNINIAWYTNLMVTRVGNSRSNLRTIIRDYQEKETMEKFSFFYDSEYRNRYKMFTISQASTLNLLKEIMKRYYNFIKSIIRGLVMRLNQDFSGVQLAKTTNDDDSFINDFLHTYELSDEIEDVFLMCQKFMIEYNDKYKSKIVASPKRN